MSIPPANSRLENVLYYREGVPSYWKNGKWHCQHKKTRCGECMIGVCEHKKRKSDCKECGGASFCEHGVRRSSCLECVGGAICEHKKRKERCKDCHGGSICEHKKQ